MPRNKFDPDPAWERRKTAIMRNYHKSMRGKMDIHSSENEDFLQGDRKSFFKRAMEEYEYKKAEKERIKQIKEKKRKEREAAIKKYLEKKKQNFKKISKKTKYGQPVMSGRMEILLEKIQKSYANDATK